MMAEDLALATPPVLLQHNNFSQLVVNARYD